MARGRPRKFDEDEVLGKAAQLFRERGYASTSMHALSEAMNMGEQSIYNAFGSKEKVFERALGQYCSEGANALSHLKQPGASLAAIEATFSYLVEQVSGGGPACLISQTCLTLDDTDTAVAQQVAQHMRSVEDHFLRALENAVGKGEIESDDPKTLARFLNMTLQGLSVLARSGTSPKALRDMLDVSLSVLR